MDQIPLNLPTSLEELYFSFNKLDGSSKDSFLGLKNLINLKNLDLSNNNLHFFFSNIFNNLKNLTYLDFSHNSLRFIPEGTFGALEKLQFLFINDNQNLIDIPALKMSTFSQLKYIFAQKCKLKTLRVDNADPLAANVSYLESIWLFGNPLACDCHILPLIKFLKTNQVELDADIKSNATRLGKGLKERLHLIKRPKNAKSVCTRPLNRHYKVTGIPLLDVYESYLYCPNEPLYVTVSCFLGIIAFMGVIPVVMILIQICFCVFNFLKKCGIIKKKQD